MMDFYFMLSYSPDFLGAFTNRNGPERIGMDRNGPEWTPITGMDLKFCHIFNCVVCFSN